MGLTAGIVGLPNVGKSTLFNAITKANALVANYPFATIEPNVGVVNVPDKRLDVLNEMYNPKSLVPATFEFTDIAGLVKGASKGEGLGNQFLANIRNCDAIVQVVRAFEDENITHVDGSIDPVRDFQTINLELIFADLETIEKRIPKIEHQAKSKVGDALEEYQLLLKLKDELMAGKLLSQVDLDKDEEKMIRSYSFLTLKKMLVVANIKESELANPMENKHYKDLCDYVLPLGYKVLPICAQVELDLIDFDEEEKKDYLQELGVSESGLDLLIRESYDLLGLKTFFTAGEKEVRAWTFKNGMKAPECAGVIHTDFEKGFIKAEVISYDDLISDGNLLNAKAKGHVRQEGKEYVFQDGDITVFKFNVTK